MSIATRVKREDFLDEWGLVKKPRNSFMIWLQEVRKTAKPAHHQTVICTWLGNQWRHLSPEMKQHYKELASQEKQIHTQLFSDYKYQPRKRTKNGTLVPNSPIKICLKRDKNGTFVSKSLQNLKNSKLKPLLTKTTITNVPQKKTHPKSLLPKSTVPENKNKAKKRKRSTYVAGVSNLRQACEKEIKQEIISESPSPVYKKPRLDDNSNTFISLSTLLVAEDNNFGNFNIHFNKITSIPTFVPNQQPSLPLENVEIEPEINDFEFIDIKMEPNSPCDLTTDEIKVEPDIQYDVEPKIQSNNIKIEPSVDDFNIECMSDSILPDLCSVLSSFDYFSDPSEPLSSLPSMDWDPLEPDLDLPHLGCEMYMGSVPTIQSLLHCCCLQLPSLSSLNVPSELPWDFLQ